MDCEQAVEAISAALDGELSEEEQAGLDAHLAGCPACRALAEDFGSLSAAMDGWEEDPPAGLAGDILAAVAAEGAPEKIVPISTGKKRNWTAWGSLAAVLALAVCLGGLFSRPDLSINSPSLVQMASPEADEGVSGENSGGAAAYSADQDPRSCDGSGLTEDLCRGTEEPQAGAGPADTAPDPSLMTLPPEDAETPAASEVPEPDAPAAKTQITEQEALELVFESLGGYETYPEAEHYDEGPAYFLQLAQTERLTSHMWLSYNGLSPDETQYVFRWYENVEYTDGEPGHIATLNWFYVPVDGGQVTAEF